MNKSMSSTRITIAAGVMVILLMSGCGTTASLTQISAFCAGTSSLADDSKRAFELVDSSTINRKMYDLAANPSLGPTDTTFEGIFDGPNFEKLRLRIAVLEKLGSYAKALEKLATADFRKEVDAASTDLYGSLSSLGSNYKKATNKELPLQDAQLKLIAAAVDAIGTAVVETKRRDAIKTVIIQADDAVQVAANLLTVDLGKDSELSRLVHENLSNTDGSLRTAYNSQRTSANSTFNIRYEMLVKIKQIHDAAETSPILFDSISAGSKKLAETHASLKSAVTKDQFSSPEIARQVGELVEYAKSIRSFYEKIGTKN
ncbi:MAG: hypothetical protein M1461_01470 [Nitrospirae bacterium]|nr:hypothetical protein [Nitrospirota bacterium]